MAGSAAPGPSGLRAGLPICLAGASDAAHRTGRLQGRLIITTLRTRLLKFAKSLHFRILLILLVVGILPINLYKYGILNNYEKQAIARRAQQIRSQCQVITEQLVESDYMAGERPELIETLISQLGSIYSGRVVIVNENLKVIKDSYGLDEGKVIIATEVIRCFTGGQGEGYSLAGDFLEVTVPVIDNATKNTAGVMIISVPTGDIHDSMAALNRTVFMLQIILTLLTIVAAFFAARMIVRPFRKVTASFEGVQGTILEEEIAMPEYTETEQLAAAYNRMLHRLRVQEDSRQEFVSNVSHELKTPLTSMKVLADSLIEQAKAGEVPNELYQEFMTDIAQEIDRENSIITDLLSLVKMDRRSADIHVEETNINHLIELILKRLHPIAAKRGIELVLESFKPVLAEVDQTKLTLALSNLIENGIKYNKDNGWVHVSLNVDNTFFYVKVEDSGMGIPEAAQDHIFERFYRVDKSHSREIGGTGLGLAITRSAVLMHHGAIRVYSREGEGSTFTVRIPLKYVPRQQEAEVTE